MPVRVGINGFGRMGRLALRAALNDPLLQWVRVNDNGCDAATAAHLFAFDSLQGRYEGPCHGSQGELLIGGHSAAFTMQDAIESDWANCDIVIEATGVHHKPAATLQRYLASGVRKVVVAAPTDGAANIVVGVNDGAYDPARDTIVTAASCTTNCLAPIVKVMHETVGIIHGSMTTLHAPTNSQRIVDQGHKDLRRARAAGQSMIPTSTGSARAITKIFPELDGRLNGHAVRVPLLGASLVDFVFEAKRAVTADEVNGLLRAAAAGPLRGILGVEDRPLVSCDFVHDPRSSIVDALSTMVIDGTQVKIYAWYDNEWGYANRLAELVRRVAAGLAG